ncbi:MAG: efflux RND transporter periplasmic adaptor subunit [Myxococcaceae bacterium]
MKPSHLVASLGVALVACEPAPPSPLGPGVHADATGVNIDANAPQWRYVQLAVAQSGKAIDPLPAPGRVAFDEARSASLGSPLGGRVETVRVRLGDSVKPGDRLFSVRSGDFADLSRDEEIAREQVGLKKRVLERQRDLFRLQAAPEKDVLAAEAELKEAELALKAAGARRASLAIDASGENIFWVKAPRAGTVVELEVSASQEVGPDRDRPLMRLSDLDEVLVLADVPENDVRAFRKGAEVQVSAQNGSEHRSGTVQYVSEVVDSHRRTVEVRVRVKNEDRLFRPNAFVSVVGVAETNGQVVRVPDTAVVTLGSKSFAFILKAPGRLEKVVVSTGRRRDGEVEVLSGLASGDTFVARGALLLLNQVELSSQ